jgi:hypothetical protein
MIPPDFSVTLALESAVWWINAAMPALALLAGAPVGATVLVWLLREVQGVMPS